MIHKCQSALARDLEKEYGNRFRILQADSGENALELMNQLKLRNEVVALFLVDQRLPQMTGVEFLQHTLNVFPDAKRVLLTDYADTDAVMKSINIIKIDYYLTKPCEPPELNLYPLLKDLA